jgi:hypothetical protein
VSLLLDHMIGARLGDPEAYLGWSIEVASSCTAGADAEGGS